MWGTALGLGQSQYAQLKQIIGEFENVQSSIDTLQEQIDSLAMIVFTKLLWLKHCVNLTSLEVKLRDSTGN